MITQPTIVTGASGEIAFQVVKQLIEQGSPVTAMVRASSKVEKLKQIGAKIVEADLRDQSSLERAFQGAYGVFHLAAVYREAGLPDETYFDVNANGTKRVFEAAIKCGVHRVIHCSTGGVLGDIKNPPGSHLTPYSPGDVYQRSKVDAEKTALEYYKSGKMRGVIIRPAMVYGPGDTRHLKLFRMVAHKKFLYIGNGKQSVHFIDIRDLARSFLIAMERDDLNGEIYHIAGARPMSLKEAVNAMADYLKIPRPRIHIPALPVQLAGSLCELICTPFGIKPPIYRRRVDFFTKSRHFDTEKSKSELGFQPTQAFEGEIRDTLEWYRKNGMI